MYINQTQIGQHQVTFKVFGRNNQIIFYVDDSVERKESTENKVAITKWLLKELKQAQLNYESLICYPSNDDGYGELRLKVYNKLAFKLVRNKLIWSK